MSEENYMRIIDLRGKKLTRAEMLEAMPRAEMGTNEATDLVQPILDDVKARGAAALRDFAEKFDHIRPENLRVPVEAMKAAVDELDPEVRAAIEESVRRSRAVSASQVPAPFHTDLAEGARVSERWIPVQRVGLYVPGGKAVYPSSVIMNVVPAQAAGVESLAIATPPSRNNADGLPDKTILATCAILGVDEVYAVGGAQAVAMFAYGAKGSEPQDGEILCDPVDKITGPGNIFVATAKRMVSGIVGIDAVAGPTEIAIIADKGANPSWLAADLIGQAEHDELAGSVLITDSEEIAEQVQENLKYRVPRTEHSERVNTSLRGRQSGIILTDESADLAASCLTLLLVLDLTGLFHHLVDLRVGVLLVVVVGTRVEVRIQEVVHGRIVGSPTKAAKGELVLGEVVEVGSPLDGVLLDSEANGLKVELDGGHEILVTTVTVVVQRNLKTALAIGVCGVASVLENLLGLIGIVLAVLPDILLRVVNGGRHDGGGGHAGTLVQGVHDVLTVDGQGEGAATFTSASTGSWEHGIMK